MGRKKWTLAIVAVLGLISGCTGTKMAIHPEFGDASPKYEGLCGSVAVREVTPDKLYPPAGNLVPGFADVLRESGLAKEVYYPARPDDKVDHTIDAKFDVFFEPNMGSNMAKSFTTGLTLFLLEPVFWYNYNYSMKGEVGLYRGPLKVSTVRSESDAEMQMKFLSLGQAVNLEGETLKQCKQALYRQLLGELKKECSTVQ